MCCKVDEPVLLPLCDREYEPLQARFRLSDEEVAGPLWAQVLGRYMELKVVPATANKWEKALPCCLMRRQGQTNAIVQEMMRQFVAAAEHQYRVIGLDDAVSEAAGSERAQTECRRCFGNRVRPAIEPANTTCTDCGSTEPCSDGSLPPKSQPAEEPAPELTGGEEAAICDVVMSESQPVAETALELIGRSSELRELAMLTMPQGQMCGQWSHGKWASESGFVAIRLFADSCARQEFAIRHGQVRGRGSVHCASMTTRPAGRGKQNAANASRTESGRPSSQQKPPAMI